MIAARHGDGADVARAPLSRTLGVARPVFGRAALATALGAGAIAADIGLIGTAGWLISRAAQHPNESALAVAIVAVQFFGLSRGFFRYGERLVGHDAAFRLLADLRVQVYTQLERLAPAGLSAFRRGDLLTRTVRDVDSQQDLVIRIIPAWGASVVVGAMTLALMWWMLPAAAIVLGVALLVAATAVPWLTGLLARRRENRFAAVRGDLAAAVLDLTDGAAELVAFGAAAGQVRTIRRHDAESTAIATACAGTAGAGLALTTLLGGLACWGCLVAGIPAVISGRLTTTELAVITLIPLTAFELVVDLPVASQALGRVRQAAARLFDVEDAPTPVAEPEPATPLPTGPYRLQADAVWAGYPGRTQPALRGVDLSLTAGRRVAVVGQSGAGKSTLGAVLVGFLPSQAGAITLNGTSIDRLPGDDLRTVVGLLAQQPYLFDASIAENLRIGRRGATDADLRDVLERVGLADWLDTLPRGLATAVGRHGTGVSGGQRQRLALARALLADFPVLVLDEPTEHLEPAAADRLTADVLSATHRRALLLITHRLAGLESVDEIVVLDAGRVIERGTHEQLLGQAGRYAELWWAELRTERKATSPTAPPWHPWRRPLARSGHGAELDERATR